MPIFTAHRDALLAALLEDESLLLSYVERHAAPQRCYMVHLKVNAPRDGVELLPIDER